jgi:hypothetical protein
VLGWGGAFLGAPRAHGSLDAISQHWLKVPLGDPEQPDALASK